MQADNSLVEVTCIKCGEETEMFPRGHEPPRFICGICQLAYEKTQVEDDTAWFEAKKDGEIIKVKK